MESHGYVLYTDPQTGHPYYYNSVTGDSKWAEDADAAGAAVGSDRVNDEQAASIESDEEEEEEEEEDDDDEEEKEEEEEDVVW